MFPALDDNDRRRLLRAALAACAVSLAILPLTMQSSLDAGAGTVSARSAPVIPREPGALAFPALRLDRDPFVPASGDLQQNDARGGTVLRAVATGEEARALVEIGGSVRVLGVGDRIGNATVTAIDSNGITLSGGVRIPLKAVRP